MYTHSSTRRFVTIFALLAGLLGVAGGAYYYLNRTVVNEGVFDYEPARDRAAILEIFRKNWYWLIADDNYSAEYMLDNRASQQTGPAGDLILKVYRVQDKTAGFLAYYHKSFYKGYVLFLVVDEEYRKKGYAEKLLRYALAQLKNDGMTIAQLITRIDNIRAQSLYKKVGMHEIWRDHEFVRFEITL